MAVIKDMFFLHNLFTGNRIDAMN